MLFILLTRPEFHAITPITRVPRIMAAPTTHSNVDCPNNRTLLFMVSSSTRANLLTKRAPNDPPEKRDHDQYDELRQVDRCQDPHQFRVDARRLGGRAVPLAHPDQQFLVPQEVLRSRTEPLALHQGADE